MFIFLLQVSIFRDTRTQIQKMIYQTLRLAIETRCGSHETYHVSVEYFLESYIIRITLYVHFKALTLTDKCLPRASLEFMRFCTCISQSLIEPLKLQSGELSKKVTERQIGRKISDAAHSLTKVIDEVARRESSILTI
jgi:hypothetical protein